MIGERIPRLEDQRLIRGHGRYTDDIQIPGQVYAAFVRAPHGHALVRSIDSVEAAAAPGVLAVLTGQDYIDAGYNGISHVANPIGPVRYWEPTFANSLTGSIFGSLHIPLAVDKVRHVGEAVVMVVAETANAAREAAERVMVDYEPLDAVVRADDALAEGAPQLWAGAGGNVYFRVQEGDAEAARAVFATAHHVVRREFRNSRVVNCQMEPRGAIGEYDPVQGRFTLTSGNQGVGRIKAALVSALNAKPEQVRVVSPDVGGGFGPRTMVYVEQVAVLWAAKVVGRPVKWTSTRSEAFVSDYQGRDGIIRAAMAFDAEGRILAVDHQWIGNVGAHPVSYVPIANGTRVINTVYHVPVTSLEITAVATNTLPTVPYRGAGRPETTYMVERLLDIAAGEMAIDRLEIRRRNIIRCDALPYLNAAGLTYDSGDFIGNMERALELADWKGFAARREMSTRNGKLRGIGMANYVEAPVGNPRERIVVEPLADGTLDIIAGTQSTGQGHETSFAQVAASLFGVDMRKVHLRTGDTEFVQNGGGTQSDRSMRLVGTMLVQASEELIPKGRAVAASLLRADVDRVQFKDGKFGVEDAMHLSWADLARHVAETGDAVALKVTIDFEGRIPAHPTGTAVCELEIDPDTGIVELQRYASVDDSGRLINPLIVEGQVHGGLAQGLGQALYEAYFVDPQTGQVLSGSYMDYGVPRAGCIPRHLDLDVTDDRTLGNPLGVKGGGEGGTMPATACVFNALADAMRDIRRDEPPMPATPGAIWDFIHLHST